MTKLRRRYGTHNNRKILRTSRASVIGHSDDSKAGIALLLQNRPIPYHPSCPGTSFCAQVVHTIGCLHAEATWCAYVPELLGHSQVIDAATAAFLKCYQYAVQPDAATLNDAVALYGLASQRLRQLLNNPHAAYDDETMLTIPLLGLFDGIAGDLRESYQAHCGGLTTLLLKRPHDRPITELTKFTVHTMGPMNFVTGLSTDDSFNNNRWLELDFASKQPLSHGVNGLRRTSNQLLLRLPRLIKAIRAMNAGEDEPRMSAWNTAAQLLLLKDTTGEDALLHRVRIQQTSDPFDQILVPVSFHFASTTDFDTAIFYWHARLLLLGALLTLMRTAPHSRAPDITPADIHAEQARLGKNIIMCWQQAAEQGLFSLTTIAHAFVALWGACGDVEMISGVPKAIVRAWIVRRTRNSAPCQLAEDLAQDFDTKSAFVRGEATVVSTAPVNK